MSDEIELPNEILERHEHAAQHAEAHVSHGGRITLLILVLAMAAAISGKISAENEMRYLTYEIERSDTWSQYQGKADRAAIAQSFAKLAAVLPNAGDPAVQQVIGEFKASADRLESDPANNDGKQQLAAKAKHLEELRNIAAKRMESFSIVVVLLAIAIGLGSASMLSRQKLPRVALATISAAAGVGAALYGIIVGFGLV